MSSSITILLLGLSACDSLLIITSLFMFGLPGILNHQACLFTTITFIVLFSLLGGLSGGQPTVQLVRQLHLPLHCPLPLSCQCFFTPYKCLLYSELFFPPIHKAYICIYAVFMFCNSNHVDVKFVFWQYSSKAWYESTDLLCLPHRLCLCWEVPLFHCQQFSAKRWTTNCRFVAVCRPLKAKYLCTHAR